MEIINISSGYMSANCYALIDRETGSAAIVDPGEDSEHIIAQINALGIKVEKILLTHGHFDHILALKKVREFTKAPVCIHVLDSSCLTDASLSLMNMIGRNDIFDPAEVMLEDGDIIKIGNSNVKVMHTSGHTLGSVCYITDAGVISGDTLFYESIGRTDFPGGDFNDIVKSIKRLFTLADDTKIYPGHGPVTAIEHEKKYNPYINT